MLTNDFQGQKLYREPAPNKRTKRDGVLRGPKRIGKIHLPVFTPDGMRLLGFMVSSPEIAGMVKPADFFVAFDALHIFDGVLAISTDKANTDKAAAKRLGINLDQCLIWTGMDVRTKSGDVLGYCNNASFDPKTGAVEWYGVTRGAASSALVGDIHMPASFVFGYQQGFMVVEDKARDLEVVGGAAAKAAEASIKVSATVKKGAKKLDDKGSVAVEKGSRALGKQLGKTRGMFTAFKDEFKKAAGPSQKKK